MFCSKCGNELSGYVSYCPNCGAKVGGGRGQININFSSREIKEKASSVKSNVLASANGLGKNMILTVITIALLFLALIISLSPTFEVKAFGATFYSLCVFDLDGLEFLKSLTIILYSAAIIATILPFILHKEWRPAFLVPALLSAIWSAVWFIIVYIVGSKETQEYDSFATFGANMSGWLLIIITIATIAICIKLIRDLKASTRSSHTSEPSL